MTKKFDVNKLVELVKCDKLEEAKSLINEAETKNVLRIFYDPCAESPRSWDNLGMLYIDQGRNYIGHDELDCDIDDALSDEDYIKLPVYRFEHSGVAYSTTPFNCHWDSGEVGYIFTTPERIKAMGLEDRSIDEITKYLANEIETYSQWANGEVLYFVVEDGFQNEIDSCHGFYSVEDIADHISAETLGFDNDDELLEHIKTIDIESND